MPIIRRFAIALLGLTSTWAACAALAPVASATFGPPPVNVVTTTMPTGDPVARVDVQDDNGDITFVPGSPGSVTRTAAWNVVEPSYSQSLSDGTLTIRAQCPYGVPNNQCSTSLLITVPAAADIQATTLNGSIAATGFQSSTISASSTNGDVSIALDTPPTNLSMSTINGDINGTVPAGTYALTASTINGRVAVSGIEPDPAASAVISAQDVNGDVTLQGEPAALPSGSGALPQRARPQPPAKATAAFHRLNRVCHRVGSSSPFSRSKRCPIGGHRSARRRVAAGVHSGKASHTLLDRSTAR